MLDKWIQSSLARLENKVSEAMDSYNLQSAVKPFVAFIEDLTNWYIRRSRRRFWKAEDDNDKLEAYSTLYEILLGLCKIAAPFTPFIAENIYKNLDDLTPKLRETFQDNRDLLMLSKDLATIKRDLNIVLPETKIKDSIFFNEEVLDNAKDEIMKYELTRFLGERKDTTQINNSEELEIVLIK